jgi:predicted TIM-barrel fold metal-dependent hydrolase
MARVAIISVDGHVKAPRADYRQYIAPKWRSAFDAWLHDVEGTGDGFVGAAHGESMQWNARQRVAQMEHQGVMAEVLFPNGAPFAAGRLDYAPDPAETRQANMAFNRWVLDFCSEAPGRLNAQALVAFHDVDQAVRDVHWAKEHGMVGILMPPLYPGSKFFFDPALDPIWAACVEAGLPLSQHGGTGAPNYQPQGMPAFMVLAAEHSFFSGRSLWQLILGGVFDRFPDLKISYIETETWWIGPMMNMLDTRARMADDWTEFAEMMGATNQLQRLPSEYWRSNCYAGISPFHPSMVGEELDRDTGTDTSFRIHSDNAMFGADFPHPESIVPMVKQNVRAFAAMPHVTDADVRKVLYANAADVFHLDLDALQPTFERVAFDVDEAVPATP